MRSLICVLVLSACVVARQNPSQRAEMSIPGTRGVLEFDVGTTTFQTRVRPDGKEVQLREFGRTDGLQITAFLQRVSFDASAEKCRDAWWRDTKKAPVPHVDLQETVVKDGIARVEFTIPEYKGVKVMQKDMHAYLGGGNLCAEIHLSKAGFKPEDQKLFEDLLASVKLSPDASPASEPQTGSGATHDSSFYFAEGSKLYLQENYPAAAVPYQKALDLEKQHRALSKNYFRVLVDNLGMSYGMTGRLPEAKATFEYGLTQDPEYPLFFYNLACTYGEMDRMDDSLKELRLAYKYRANMIEGEEFPDPMKDDSFRHFANKPEFVSAVRDMQK
jgi:tetratricopeptide (TPR) repeat protein